MTKQPPPYHLRLNKAVDRLLLVELLKQLDNKVPGFAQNACYCGFGGPYLEDIRQIHENFPKMRLFSVEKYKEVHKRQDFHRPCSNVTLIHGNYNTVFDNEYKIFTSNAVIWLDYTDFEPSVISDFIRTICAFQCQSVLRITIKANYKESKQHCADKPSEAFRKNFGDYFPSVIPIGTFQNDEGFIQLIREIFLIAAQRESPTLSGRTFVPVLSTFYSDTTTMFSLTGIVCISDNAMFHDKNESMKADIAKWEFANELRDKMPERIDLPHLSIKERLHLQQWLPCNGADPGEILFNALGHNISTGDVEQTKILLRNYAKFYRYYPYFIRGNP